jgi:chlorobactene glucosyltransferase
VVVVWNALSNIQLSKTPAPGSRQLISILIPAKNEEKNIMNILQSIKNQDYVDYEVLILDDQSDDKTAALINDFILQDSRFRLIRGKDLPKDWMGKNYACHQLYQEARGEYFLFLDADVIIQPGLIDRALNRMKKENLSLLSLFADQEMVTLGEWITVPLMNYFLLSFLPLSLIKKSKEVSVAAANGQFMLFPASSYKENQWHFQVRNKVAEDYEICKRVKSQNLRAETLLSNGFLSCRMYSGFEEGVHGFTKNTFALFNYNLIGMILFLAMISVLDILIFIQNSFALSLVILFQILAIRIISSSISRQNLWINTLLHPIQIGIMIYISTLSIIKNYTGTLSWKGRTIKPQMAAHIPID